MKIIAVIYLIILTLTSLNACISEKIDPEYKNNFYKTVNKEWIKEHHIPDDKMGISNFSLINDKIILELKEIVASLQVKKILTSDEQKIFNVYSSYINIKNRDAQGVKVLKDEIEMINAASSHKDISALFAKFQKISIGIPLVFYVYADKKDSNKNIVYATQNGINLLKDYYKQENEKSKKEVKLLRGLYSDLLSLAKFENSAIKAKNVINLESKLAQIQWSKIENRDSTKTYNIVDFKGLDKSLSSLDMQEYLKSLGISTDTRFSVNQPSYFNSFNKLFTSTDVQTWKDYLRVQLLMHYGGYLTTEFTNCFANRRSVKLLICR